VIKASYPDHAIPKPKHVNAILDVCHGDKSASREVVQMIVKRMEKARNAFGQWQIMFKSLLVLHKLMQYRRDSSFFEVLAETSPAFLNLSTYLDRSSTSAWGYSKFCQDYAHFLSDRILSFREIGPKFEVVNAETKKRMRAFKPGKLLKMCDILCRQFERLVQCKPFEETQGFHPLSKYCMVLLAKDAYNLTTLLSLAVYTMLDYLEDATEAKKKKFVQILDTYATSLHELSVLRNMFKALRNQEVMKLIPTEKECKKTLQFINKVKGYLLGKSDGEGLFEKSFSTDRKRADSEEVISLDDFLGSDGDSKVSRHSPSDNTSGTPSRSRKKSPRKKKKSPKKRGAQKTPQQQQPDLFAMHFSTPEPQKEDDALSALFSVLNTDSNPASQAKEPAFNNSTYNPFLQNNTPGFPPQHVNAPQAYAQHYQANPSNPLFQNQMHGAAAPPPSQQRGRGALLGLRSPPKANRSRSSSATKKSVNHQGNQQPMLSVGGNANTRARRNSADGPGINFDELFS